MSELKHTPKPWHVDAFDCSGYHHVMSGGDTVAKVCKSIEQGDSLALARLIAAAPSMLTALEAQERVDEHVVNCEDCCDGAFVEMCEDGFPIADEARLLRRAAIEKATGATQ